MPAYVREIPTPRCAEPGCGRKATHEVFNGVNSSIGKYCRQDAARVLARTQPPGGPGERHR